MRLELQRVEVDWIDSAFHRGWSSLDTKRKEMDVAKCRTIGYIVEETDAQIKIVQSISDDGVSDGIAIPKACVSKIRKVK